MSNKKYWRERRAPERDAKKTPNLHVYSSYRQSEMTIVSQCGLIWLTFPYSILKELGVCFCKIYLQRHTGTHTHLKMWDLFKRSLLFISRISYPVTIFEFYVNNYWIIFRIYIPKIKKEIVHKKKRVKRQHRTVTPQGLQQELESLWVWAWEWEGEVFAASWWELQL